MIRRAKAIALCEAHFPRGPEYLAEHLGISVREQQLEGCDGWCVRCRSFAIIRLNTANSGGRQRFTLAHEISHIILGTTGHIVGSRSGAYRAESDDETEANKLAAELLLPVDRVREVLTSTPVDAPTLRRLSRRARVSQVMAACRAASLAGAIGLDNAAVIGFEAGEPRWRWSETLRGLDDAAVKRLFERATAAGPNLHREPRPDGHVVCASVIRAKTFSTLFVQVLPEDLALTQTPEERRNELSMWLFEGDIVLRRKMNGYFGSFRDRRAHGMTPEQAADAFLALYLAEPERMVDRLRKKLTDPRAREWLVLSFRRVPL